MDALKQFYPDPMLGYLLQKDQAGTKYYLNQAALHNGADRNVSGVVKSFIYPRVCGLAAVAASLKDPLIYPIQGAAKVVFSILTLDKHEFLTGAKELFISPLQSIALSVYLLGVSLLGLGIAKKVYDSIKQGLEYLEKPRPPVRKLVGTPISTKGELNVEIASEKGGEVGSSIGKTPAEIDGEPTTKSSADLTIADLEELYEASRKLVENDESATLPPSRSERDET